VGHPSRIHLAIALGVLVTVGCLAYLWAFRPDLSIGSSGAPTPHPDYPTPEQAGTQAVFLLEAPPASPRITSVAMPDRLGRLRALPRRPGLLRRADRAARGA
jgi:hypothetical protein